MKIRAQVEMCGLTVEKKAKDRGGQERKGERGKKMPS
jgi:hypothetical protein